MKYIQKLFIFFIAISFVFQVALGGETMTECDDLNQAWNEAQEVYNNCTDPCAANCNNYEDYDCLTNCESVVCKTQRDAEAVARQAYWSCYNSTLGITGPEFSLAGEDWDNNSIDVWIQYHYHGDRLFDQSQNFYCGGKVTVNGGTISHIQEDSLYCIVYIKDITEDSVTVNAGGGIASLGSILSVAGSETYTRPGSGNDEGSGDATGCCPAGYSATDEACCNGDECVQDTCDLDQWRSDCTDLSNITLNNVSSLHKQDDGSCCFDGGYEPACDDSLEQRRIRCSDIDSALITTESIQYINDGSMYANEGCCFHGGGYEPQCICEHPLTDGECEEGYKPDGDCCVEMSCDEANATEKESCEKKSGMKWENCECVCDPAQGCCGIQLNVPIPFIGDCIELTTSNSVGSGSRDGTVTVNQLNAFPYLIQGLSKILVTLIMIFSIIVVIVAGLMMTTSVASEQNYKKGVDILKKVLVALILLGTSGLILKLINPNFFGG